MKIIKIDGSFGEGGGQIMRTSLSMAAITHQACEIFNIRLTRKPKPKLRPQHLMAAIAVAKITKGDLYDAELGSDHFTFQPGKIASGEYEFDIGTAGSSILVAQTIIPILLHADEVSKVRIMGGTNLHQSPSYDYFQQIFLKAIKRFNADVKCKLISSGYFPRGGGIIELTINPSQLIGCANWQKKENTKAQIRITNLPSHIAEREKNILEQNNIKQIKICEETALSPGNTVTIWQGFRGCTELGVRGVLAEKIAEKAYQKFIKENEEIDIHLADQLLIYAALGKGSTRYKTSIISQHLLTNAYTISHFINRSITFEENLVLIK